MRLGRVLEAGSIQTCGRSLLTGASHGYPQHHAKSANYQATYCCHWHCPGQHLGGYFSLLAWEKLSTPKGVEEWAFLGKEARQSEVKSSLHPSIHLLKSHL